MRTLVSALILLPALAACGEGEISCTTEAIPSVQMTVTDADDNLIDDVEATWTAEDGNSGDCEPAGLDDQETICGWEVGGPMTITVSAPGYAEQVIEVDVPEDECHVETQMLDVVLEPAE